MIAISLRFAAGSWCWWMFVALALLLIGCGTPAPSGDVAGGTPADFATLARDPLQDLQFRRRIALIVGNANYTAWDKLPAGRADAVDMAATVRQSGFELIGGQAQVDVDGRGMAALLAQLESEVRRSPGAIVLVYFSGHGLAQGADNMLVPTDAQLPDGRGRIAEAASVGAITQRLAQANAGLTLMFIDACRSTATGRVNFVDQPAVPRSFIGYGSYFGTPALARLGAAHSVYTEALLGQLRQPWQGIDELHTQVGASVAAATGFAQVPVYRADPALLGRPLHLATTDPASTYARIPENGRTTSVDALASHCAMLATTSMLGSLIDLPRPASGPGLRAVVMSPPPGTPADALAACRAAYRAGSRDAGTLRGMALTMAVAWRNGGVNRPTDEEMTQVAGWLYQAAEQGDPDAEMMAAVFESRDLPGSPPGGSSRALQRFLHAAETGRSPLSTVVATALITGPPERGALSRIRTDPTRGRAVLVKAAENFDAGALQMLFIFGGGIRNAPVPGTFRAALGGQPIPVRQLLRNAVDHGDVGGRLVAWALPGMTVFQTVHAYAIADAAAGIYGPGDLQGLVQLAVKAEPWFDRFQDWADPTGAGASAVGCSLLGGMKSRKPLPDMRNPALGIRFLKLAAARGYPSAERWLAAAAGGMAAPCAMDADLYAKPSR
ncbi:MAG: caspase family protein [Ferrovibrionaceae bacterium]